ncbi:hypothetical protein [Pseudonocardia sp. MH-G8]|uniref:hypothetical protein n=1 Tax=Pseudonocardia sp. MH-G8 TaxID=1854588 RepID=UPI000BA04FEB|nr:hypothetical protein [Pseudonocardia sp. MH-G8]OZM79022.1 hypothetical protein CFP66_27190 [Pseudonocardia sp. MH-G8]
MRRPIAAAALLTALVLSGTGPPAVAAAQQPPGTDVGACLDGSCTLRVTGPVEIPLDGRAGPSALTVTDVGTYAVTFMLSSGNARSYGVTGPGGTVQFASPQGTLTIRVLELAGGTATFELSSTAPEA